MYVTSFANGSVLRYNGVSGAFQNVFASGGSLTEPTYLVFTPEPAGLALIAAFAAATALRRRRESPACAAG